MKDLTLNDYINRTLREIEKEKFQIAQNRNVWNDHELTKQDIYYVYPEDDGTDSKNNPYSSV